MSFEPLFSTDDVCRGTELDRCLSDDLDAIENDIAELEESKAESNHQHSGYALTEHTHTGFAPENHTHTGFAAAEHTHEGFAAAEHTHAGFAAESHTHSEYANAEHTHAEYANAEHTHTGYAADNHAHSEYAPVNHNHWDDNPAPLWSGAVFMNGNQTITPSKKLSECRNGWILLWSDYDSVNGGATNGDVFASYVPKRCYSGENWSGHSWLVDIPTEASSAAETRCIKKVYMWNDRIVGNVINEVSPRNDVVLRAVYEF